MRVECRRVDWPFAAAFKIAYQVQTSAETIAVELHDQGLIGRGEALGVSYHGETPELLLRQLDNAKNDLAACRSRADVHALLPPGGARNAVDCAMWDLEGKRAGRRAWELAGIDEVKPLLTAFTLSLDEPAIMRQAAVAASQYSLLKLKLGGASDLDRVAAVREARPDARIIVDANQGWNDQQLRAFPPRLAELGVELIEQPLPAGSDAVLAGYDSPVPLCADESCQTTQCLPSLAGKYQYVNVKLDKCGGLTEALRLARAAKEQGFGLMIGCMAGSSLSMAPAFIVGQLCAWVDLDGPLLSAGDVPDAIRYEGSRMFAPTAALWG